MQIQQINQITDQKNKLNSQITNHRLSKTNKPSLKKQSKNKKLTTRTTQTMGSKLSHQRNTGRNPHKKAPQMIKTKVIPKRIMRKEM